jgi:hypothetical protein
MWMMTGTLVKTGTSCCSSAGDTAVTQKDE